MILVVGSGVAGLSAALAAVREGGDVLLVTAGALGGQGSADGSGPRLLGNTPLAQGGIAAAIGAADRVADHLQDTVAAGAGLTQLDAAEVLVVEGARRMRELLDAGFAADRDAAGGVALGLEAAHGRERIVHAGGDRTGAVLHAHLASRLGGLMPERARRAGAPGGSLEVREGATVEALTVEFGAVVGATVRDARGRVSTVRADAVVLATGGYASLYPMSSNHPSARGAGVMLGARAGAVLADLEFVQFHPTVLVEGLGAPADVRTGARADVRADVRTDARADLRSLLISEAVRGAGAVLRDARGARFMLGRHPRAELAPRDVVSLEVHRALERDDAREVWLDATPVERSGGRGALRRRFPGISRALAARGIDWARDPVPVAPAAHYTMGGIASDAWGRSSVPGLFAAGEVAATGVHGANRLASNSLLEGLVFGARAGVAAAAYRPGGGAWIGDDGALAGLIRAAERCALAADLERGATASEAEIGRAVGSALGIERSGAGLARADRVFRRGAGDAARLASVVGAAAALRTESRGAHLRADFPGSDPAQARRRGVRVIEAAPSSASGRERCAGGAVSLRAPASATSHRAAEQRSA
ncbi:L-aspartate oxidase [Leucobacter chromiiresistens]